MNKLTALVVVVIVLITPFIFERVTGIVILITFIVICSLVAVLETKQIRNRQALKNLKAENSSPTGNIIYYLSVLKKISKRFKKQKRKHFSSIIEKSYSILLNKKTTLLTLVKLEEYLKDIVFIFGSPEETSEKYITELPNITTAFKELSKRQDNNLIYDARLNSLKAKLAMEGLNSSIKTLETTTHQS